MDNKTAVDLVISTFSKISQAENIEELESILEEDVLKSARKNPIQYPKIEFKIDPLDFENVDYLEDDNSFNSYIQKNLKDPLAKVLFATVWKNGDLLKVKHIIKGIKDSSLEYSKQNDALVFYQFGKHLSNDREPIIDQHVIRAFNVYQNSSKDESIIIALRTMKTITNNHNAVINQYKEWLNGAHEVSKFSNFKEYSYHIDNILFALGKTIKLKN